MIPRFESSDAEIPPQAAFWMPTEEDIPADEGIGFFRNVWMILGVSRVEADVMASQESEYIAKIDDLTASPEEFERVAACLDRECVDSTRDPDTSERLLEAFPGLIDESDDETYNDEPFMDLGSLEVGVAALSRALAYIGGVPVASCRAHIASGSWADRPVVYAALNRQRVEWLQPLIRENDCGFHTDPNRGQFLVVDAPSIVESNALALRIVRDFSRDGCGFERWLDLKSFDWFYGASED
ncbi:hypothetical protein ACH4LT_08540 [Streptomyces clavifer]|uniref:hypothetical protein n=1 Tax=Streptomyces clavifer TaxID=68188 RepID=UPI0037B9415E